MEQQVINDIARRVKKMGRYTETAELQAKAMREQGYSTSKIQSEVLRILNADKDRARALAEETAAYKREVKAIIEQTVKDAKKAGNELIATAGDMAWNDDMQMWKAHNVDLKKDSSLSQLQKAFVKQTQGMLYNITNTTGFKGTGLGTPGITGAFQRSMDLATLKVASGTFSYNEAIRDCVRMLSKSGLRSVDYASGRSYEIESAARMIVRTATSQLAGQITMMNCEKTGQDLVYVDEHAGARPEHAIWQGAVYSRSGKSKKYADFYKATDYGSPTGLKGVNCSHNFYPYWDGDALPEHIETPDVEYNGESMTYYEATQEQRAMERNIRQLNRELNATKAMGLDTTELQKKFNSAVDKYADFSMQTGIRAKADRLGGAWTNMTKESRRGLMDAKARNIATSERENGNRGLDKDRIIKRSFIESGAYKSVFNKLNEDRHITELLVDEARKILNHRNGTVFEDLLFYNTRTDTLLVSTEIDKRKQCEPTPRMDKMWKNKANNRHIIAIHNHPDSSIPSDSDIYWCEKRKYKYGLIIGHDGSVYKYSTDNPNYSIYISAVERLKEQGYNKDSFNTFIEEVGKNGVKIEVLHYAG